MYMELFVFIIMYMYMELYVFITLAADAETFNTVTNTQCIYQQPQWLRKLLYIQSRRVSMAQYIIIIIITITMYMFLMRDEKKERKKQAKSNKQTRQSNTARHDNC